MTIEYWLIVCHNYCWCKMYGKRFPYSLSSVGPGADPDVQAVSLQVTVSYPPGGRLPLLSARPAVTFPATKHHRPLAGTKLYCLVIETHRCEQLAQGCYAAFTTSRIWAHDLLIASPTLYPLRHRALIYSNVILRVFFCLWLNLIHYYFFFSISVCLFLTLPYHCVRCLANIWRSICMLCLRCITHFII